MQEFVLKRNLHKEINWGGKLGEKLATALSFKEDKKPQLSKPPRKKFRGPFSKSIQEIKRVYRTKVMFSKRNVY